MPRGPRYARRFYGIVHAPLLRFHNRLCLSCDAIHQFCSIKQRRISRLPAHKIWNPAGALGRVPGQFFPRRLVPILPSGCPLFGCAGHASSDSQNIYIILIGHQNKYRRSETPRSPCRPRCLGSPSAGGMGFALYLYYVARVRFARWAAARASHAPRHC